MKNKYRGQKNKMLKQVIEMLITGTVIFIGICMSIGLLILIVSSLKDFFFDTKNQSKERYMIVMLFNILVCGTFMIFISFFFVGLICGFTKFLQKIFKWEPVDEPPQDGIMGDA